MYARRKTIKRHRPRWSPPIRWGRPSPQTHCSETKQRAQHNASEPSSRWKQTTMETVMKSTVKTALLVAVMCSVLLTTSHANFYGKRNGGYGKSLKDILQEIQLREPAGRAAGVPASAVLQQIGELASQWDDEDDRLNRVGEEKRARI
ncbi:hypothetical protein LSAT2_012568 [Lamellibrachia satsuma]|nr:hypothetical protein LSAT2_012568 [Lamellibrachia satsuma]